MRKESRAKKKPPQKSSQPQNKKARKKGETKKLKKTQIDSDTVRCTRAALKKKTCNDIYNL